MTGGEDLQRQVLRLLAERDQGLSAAALSVATGADEADIAMTLDALHRHVRRDEATGRWVARAAPLPLPAPPHHRQVGRWRRRTVMLALLGALAGMARGGAGDAIAWAIVHAALIAGVGWTVTTGPPQDPLRSILGFLLRIPAVVVPTLACLVLLEWLVLAVD